MTYVRLITDAGGVAAVGEPDNEIHVTTLTIIVVPLWSLDCFIGPVALIFGPREREGQCSAGGNKVIPIFVKKVNSLRAKTTRILLLSP